MLFRELPVAKNSHTLYAFAVMKLEMTRFIGTVFLTTLAALLSCAFLTLGTEGEKPTVETELNEEYESLEERQSRLVEAVRELRGSIPSDELPISEVSGSLLVEASGTMATLDFWVEEVARLLDKDRNDADLENIRGNLNRAEEALADVQNNIDPFEPKTGLFEKAYRSSYDSTLQPYAVFVPKEYSGQKTPLILALHGMYGDHWQVPRVMKLDKEPDRMPWLVAAPYGRGSMGYWGPAEKDVWDVLSLMMEDYNVDPDRIYITGLSMGGFGTFNMGMTRPDVFAAAAPICGAGQPELALNALWLPYYIFHGERDKIVPMSRSVEMKEALESHGYEVKFRSYPDAQHDSWTPTYGGDELFEWFAEKRRVTKPPKIAYRTKNIRFNKAYWIIMEGLEKYGEYGEVVAEIVGSTVQVSTKNVSSFSINFDESPIPSDTRVTVVRDGTTVYDGEPSGIRSLFVDATTANGKRHGLSGPLIDVTYDKFLYVYGTQSEGPARNQVAKQEAEAAADWGELVKEQFPVKPDTEVNPVDIMERNLILFGDPSCNRLVAEMQSRLPVKFGEGSIQVGESRYEGEDIFTVFIHPNPLNPNRYVVVVAGVGPEALRGCHELNIYNGDSDLFIFDKTFVEGERSMTKAIKPTKPLLALCFDGNWQVPGAEVR